MTKAKAIEILNELFDSYLTTKLTANSGEDKSGYYHIILRDMLDEKTDKKIALLTAIDALEAEPVKHGKWIIDYAEGGEIYHAHCSECNNEPDRNIGGDYYIDKLSDYCPNCGARMDGDSE